MRWRYGEEFSLSIDGMEETTTYLITEVSGNRNMIVKKTGGQVVIEKYTFTGDFVFKERGNLKVHL